MTCVVVIVSDTGTLVFAADAGAYADDSKEIRNEPKVFTVCNVLVGFSGSFRVAQLIQYGLINSFDDLNDATQTKSRTVCSDCTDELCETYKYTESEHMLKYIINTFVPSVQKVLKRNGCLKVVENIKSMDCELFIGLTKMNANGAFRTPKIFKIDSEFQVSEVVHYSATGSGAAYALGSLDALLCSNLSLTAYDASIKSLSIASHYCQVVIGPYSVVEL